MKEIPFSEYQSGSIFIPNEVVPSCEKKQKSFGLVQLKNPVKLIFYLEYIVFIHLHGFSQYRLMAEKLEPSIMGSSSCSQTKNVRHE